MGADGSRSQAIGLKQNLEQNKNVGQVHCRFVALFTISLRKSKEQQTANTSQRNQCGTSFKIRLLIGRYERRLSTGSLILRLK